MGDIVDLDAERAKRQAQTDRAVAKVALPRPTPLIDRDWDEGAGQYVATVYVPGWSAPFHVGRDFGDET